MPGVARVTATPTGVRVELTGPPGPVLRAATDAGLVDVRSREASLEEIFLAYYGEPDGDRETVLSGAPPDGR
jgi:hypothetical protein